MPTKRSLTNFGRSAKCCGKIITLFKSRLNQPAMIRLPSEPDLTLLISLDGCPEVSFR
jgi:hypothetical protein